jgi:hypothetical protein
MSYKHKHCNNATSNTCILSFNQHKNQVLQTIIANIHPNNTNSNTCILSFNQSKNQVSQNILTNIQPNYSNTSMQNLWSSTSGLFCFRKYILWKGCLHDMCSACSLKTRLISLYYISWWQKKQRSLKEKHLQHVIKIGALYYYDV